MSINETLGDVIKLSVAGNPAPAPKPIKPIKKIMIKFLKKSAILILLFSLFGIGCENKTSSLTTKEMLDKKYKMYDDSLKYYMNIMQNEGQHFNRKDSTSIRHFDSTWQKVKEYEDSSGKYLKLFLKSP